MKEFIYNTSVLALAMLIAGAVLIPFIVKDGTGTDAGRQGRVLYATTTVAGPQTINTIASARDYCAARIINATTSLSLSFDTGFTPTAQKGVFQGTGTTAYPSDVYGCGAISAFAPATTTLTVTDVVY